MKDNTLFSILGMLRTVSSPLKTLVEHLPHFKTKEPSRASESIKKTWKIILTVHYLLIILYAVRG